MHLNTIYPRQYPKMGWIDLTTMKKKILKDVAIKKSSHYINSNSSIFKVVRVQFTLKSGSRGTPIGLYFLEKSNFSLFFCRFFPNISGNPGRKSMLFWRILIVYVCSKPLWVWFVGSTYFTMRGKKNFFYWYYFFS